MFMKMLMPLILLHTLPCSAQAGDRFIPERPEVRSIEVGFNGETLKAYYLLIDARTKAEKDSDRDIGVLKGPAIVFFNGHAQRPDDAYEFTSNLACMSRSGIVVVPVCDTPYGDDETCRGDSGKDIVLMAVVRHVFEAVGIRVEGCEPAYKMYPCMVKGSVVTDEKEIHAKLLSMGWSHGGILARRFAHAYPGTVVGLGQVCPSGYEKWGTPGIMGRFTWECLRISARLLSGNVREALGTWPGFIKGMAGDFIRSVPLAVDGMNPSKLSRVIKDMSDCSEYYDGENLPVDRVPCITVIFGADDTCMSARRQLGIDDPQNLTEKEEEGFWKRFYPGSVARGAKLRFMILPGNHVAPAVKGELYARTVLEGLGQLSGQ